MGMTPEIDLDDEREAADKKRPLFFYGWIMFGLAILLQVGTSPGQTFGISVFNRPIRDSLELSQSTLAASYLIASLLAAMPLPFLGWLIDRYGLRRSGIGVICLLGLGCIVISQANGVVTLTIGFLFLRTFGQGGLTLVANNTLAMWFSRRLGLVSGMAGVGFAIALAFVPAGYLTLIEGLGWRQAYVVLALITWGLLLPVVLLLFRNRPEEVGQQIDGRHDTMWKSRSTNTKTSNFDDFTYAYDLWNAWKTRAYWIGLSLTALWGMIGTAIFFHLVPLFAWKGLSETQATSTFFTFATCMAAMQLIGGALADRMPLNVLLSTSALGLLGGVVTLWNLQNMWMAHVYAVQFGCSQGLLIAVGNTLWPRYFGLVHLGRIRSSVWTATVAGCSFGPLLMGLSFDFLGGFGPSLGLFAGLLAVGAVVALFATAPPRKVHF